MKLYIPCTNPDKPQAPRLIQDSFSWRVLFFGWLGLLSYGAWISALFIGAITFPLQIFLKSEWSLVAMISLHAIVAAYTPEIRLWEMRLRGRHIETPILATNKEIALIRWAEQPALSATPAELPCASS